MSTVHIDLPPPPISWEHLPPRASQDVTLRQWIPYWSTLQNLGYTLWPRTMPDENGQLIELAEPKLSPPTNCFEPSESESYVYFPMGYIGNGGPASARVQLAVDRALREVAIKTILSGSSELRVVEYLAKQRKEEHDPRDHTIPFLQLITTDHCTFAVMPYWSNGVPPFYAIGEPIEMLRQCLEGLAYYHQHRVAHCDISSGNVVMNFGGFYPGPSMDGGRFFTAPFRSKFPVQYAFIDFGTAVKFEEDTALTDVLYQATHHTMGFSAPEVVLGEPYNPFSADVYAVASVIINELNHSKHYHSRAEELLRENVPAFFELLGRMRAVEPRRRPSAEAALQELLHLVSVLSPDILELHGQGV
ncbi:kinase-like protein [Exidia glandulosa HHB12029]|uniref:Kinase-like protein n=1 Tax=Exidia glandulosa HHB12029 TaxID=1314781 RepID=A0A165PZ18_EXIGL|nr:kinase-like protein [Exidia glandulosa HHB12029]